MKFHYRGGIAGVAVSLAFQFFLFLGLYGGTGTFLKPGGGGERAAVLFIPSIVVIIIIGLMSVFSDD
jgi:hypothetical protein